MIKRIFFLLIIVNLFDTIQAQVYVVKKDVVYYYDEVIKGADANTFDITENIEFTKDKSNVYFKGKQTGYDAKTFEIHPNYISDKNDVYIYNYYAKLFFPIHSTSPKLYAKNSDNRNISVDTASIFWENTKLINSDAKTLQLVSDYIFYDKNNVYHKKYRLPLNADNLQFFGPDKNKIKYIADASRVCSLYGKCHVVDVNTFKYINRNYVKDNKKVLHNNIAIKADGISFDVPNKEMEYFSQDKYYDFYLGNAFPERVNKKDLVSEKAFNNYLEFVKTQLKNGFSSPTTSISSQKEPEQNLTLLYTFPKSKNTKIEKGKHIYMNGIIQPFIDAESFVIYNNDYAKDNNNVYLIHEHDDYVLFNIIDGVDVKTFSIVEENENYYAYCKDAYNVFFSMDKIEGADPKTFTFLNDNFSSDSKNVFFENNKLTGVTPIANATIEKINHKYYTYGSQILYINNYNAIAIKNPDLNNFKTINYYYAVQGNNIMFKGHFIGTLEENETIITNDNYHITTSKNKIYRYGKLINGENKKWLQSYGTSYLTDGFNLFTKDGKEIPKTSLVNVFHSGSNIKYTIFKNGKALYNDYMFDIDLPSFEQFYNTDFAKDKNHVYYKGKITSYDAKTFHRFPYSFLMDKTGVYFEKKRIEEADVDTFNAFYGYGFDKNNFYFRSKVIPRSQINLKK